MGSGVVSESVDDRRDGAAAIRRRARCSAGTRDADVGVELDQGERPRPDRLVAERVVGQVVDRDVGQEVGRRDRLGQRLEEAAERRRQREGDRRGPDAVTVTSLHDVAAGPV